MSRNNRKIELLITPGEESLWFKTLEEISEVSKDGVWDLPLWIVPDTRHQGTAEIDLMRALGKQALPTGNIHTLLSFAGTILGLPIYDVIVRPTFASLRLGEILDRECPDEYIRSSKTPGFTESLWTAIEDCESRGYFPAGSLFAAEGNPPPPHFTILQHKLHESCASLGRYSAGEILRRAIQQMEIGGFNIPPPGTVFIGPFYKPTSLEIAFIQALSENIDKCVLAVPPQATWHHKFDLAEAPQNQDDTLLYTPVIIRPKTPEDECDTIFSFIAEYVLNDKTRRYRDVRVIVPFIRNNLPRIEASARRYHVPIKAGMPQSLISFPGVQLLLKLLDLFTGRWQREDVLEILRSRVLACPIEGTSTMIKRILESGYRQNHQAGEQWIEMARNLGLQSLSDKLDVLYQLDLAFSGEVEAEAFIDFITGCTDVIKTSADLALNTNCELQYEEGWRALDNLLRDIEISQKHHTQRADLIIQLKSALRVCNYIPNTPDTDAVEIISNNQEDHLPTQVVIYIGLNSRVPSISRPNPFTKEEGRKTYQEEFRRFRLHLSNAEHKVLLSCPRHDDEGDELALSPFLRSLETDIQYQMPPQDVEMWHPRPVDDKRVTARDPKGRNISRNKSLSIIRELNQRWNPTRLDDAIQCPFLHFARHILGLSEYADNTLEGVTAPLLGAIAHGALEQYLKAVLKEQSFEIESWIRAEFNKRTETFDPHPEADKGLEQLIYDLNEFIKRNAAELIPGFTPDGLELRFKEGREPQSLILDLPVGQVQLEGRIDRIDVANEDDCVVFDYKYSKLDSQKSENFFTDLGEGFKPQLPLYALLITEVLKKRPVAFYEMHLRTQALLGIRLSRAPEPGEAFMQGSKIEEADTEIFNSYIARAIGKLEEMVAKTGAGTIRPQPRDADRCGPGKCEYADLCRFRQRWRKPLA